MDGLLIIHKPAGMSSFKCLAIVRRKLGLQKVGHLGTLDPLASGVLVLLVGRYTKRMNELSGATKVYQSVFTFGIETDTLDAGGRVIASVSEATPPPTREQIEAILPSLVGEIEIEVPKFSAVHINGKRAYALARQGVDFIPPKKVVSIKRFELTTPPRCARHPSIQEGNFSSEYFFEIECQTGTYIRSLAKLLAQKLGTVAIASTIIRTKVGEFAIEDAKSLEDVTVGDIMTI